MNTPRHIIETYEKADFEMRLHLFLSHRSLRNQFDRIEQRERISALSGPALEKGSWWQQLRMYCLSRALPDLN